MKKLSYFSVFFILIHFFSCENNDLQRNNSQSNSITKRNTISGIEFNMLWNENGVCKRSFIHQNLKNGLSDSINNPAIWHLCDLSEADIVNNGFQNTWPYKYNTTMGHIQSPNRTAPSFKIITEGYSNSQYGGFYPGYAVWVQNGFQGIPLTFKLINNAKQLVTNNELFEVAIVFEHWYNQWGQGRWSFKEQYKLSELEYIKPSFDIKLEHFNNYQSPNPTSTTYLTADLRIEYRKDDLLERTDLIGVIFSNFGGINGFDLNNIPNDNIFWDDMEDNDRKRILLHGYNIGITHPNLTQVQSSWRTITFDFIPLIQDYLPPPPSNCTYEDAIIVGFDIYSSTRSADIDFSLKNIYLRSKKN